MEKTVDREWLPEKCTRLIDNIANEMNSTRSCTLIKRIEKLAQTNKQIHEEQCFNLNPATNVMNPAAERLLSSGLGSRPSLGNPGDKYEMGLEAIEEIEIIAAELCAQVFNAKYAEIRVASGAMANLYAFMAICKPGDSIIVPPATIGGHVTHHGAGAAGLYGLDIHPAPICGDGYTMDLEKLRDLAIRIQPKLITIGGSLNLFAHPVYEIRQIADEVNAMVLFDAAHLCGMIAGNAWENPLDLGAHLMTMSTYKSLGGPAGGLLVTNESSIAERLDAIAYPGMTANFDVAKSAALAITMLDWKDFGKAYATKMKSTAACLALHLKILGIEVFTCKEGITESHQFALMAAPWGGGQNASKHLRKAGFLACGIGLPAPEVMGDLNGLRIGTPELVRWGMQDEDMPELALRISTALKSSSPKTLAPETMEYRKQFQKLEYINK